MRAQIADGLSAAEAARLVLDPSCGYPRLGSHRPHLRSRSRYATCGPRSTRSTTSAAHAALDRLIASLSLETFLRDVVLPLLREIGERWERGEITIAQEHFASSLIRGRLMSLGRGWGRGSGRHALLAAPSGEQHDLGLVVLALVLRDRGWRVTFLGADTPVETIIDTSRRLAPEVIVLAMLKTPELERSVVRELARGARVVMSGNGVGPETAHALGVEHFAGGPIEAAAHLANGAAT